MIRRPPRSTLFPYTDALPICTHNVAGIVAMAAAMRATVDQREATVAQVTARRDRLADGLLAAVPDRKSTRLNSSHANISYAVFCLKKKKTTQRQGMRYSRPDS